MTIDNKYNIIMVGPNLTIEAPQINDSGVYTLLFFIPYLPLKTNSMEAETTLELSY
jgi:hypothetical protein